jgi:hypothetical protein
MKRKYNVYTVNVSDDYYVYNPDTQAYEWAEEYPELRKDTDNGNYYREKPRVFPKWQDAVEYARKKSEYNSCVTIDDVCCGEVWQSVESYKKCKCCGHEVIDGFYSDDHHDEPQHDWQLPEHN